MTEFTLDFSTGERHNRHYPDPLRRTHMNRRNVLLSMLGTVAASVAALFLPKTSTVAPTPVLEDELPDDYVLGAPPGPYVHRETICGNFVYFMNVPSTDAPKFLRFITKHNFSQSEPCLHRTDDGMTKIMWVI